AVCGGKGGRRLVAAIRHAKPTAKIDEVDDKAVRPQGLDKLLQQGEGIAEGTKGSDLAANMQLHAARNDTRQPASEPIERERLAKGDAEFVLCLPSRDLVMSLGVDIGVDAERYAGRAAERARCLAQEPKLRL